MQVALTEVDSSANQRKIVLDRLPVLIGHSPEAAVRLDDHWVSRQHCEISAVRDTLVVRDLGSMLGTFVNGLSVTTAHLMPGDRLTVGVTSFQVDYDRPAMVPPSPRLQTRATTPADDHPKIPPPAATRSNLQPVRSGGSAHPDRASQGAPQGLWGPGGLRELLPRLLRQAVDRVRGKPR